MKRLSERMAQQLTDVRDLGIGMNSAKESQIQKILWGVAALTVAFLSYSALRFYYLGQILGAETVTYLGSLLMIPMFAILHLLGPIRQRKLRIGEARWLSSSRTTRISIRASLTGAHCGSNGSLRAPSRMRQSWNPS